MEEKMTILGYNVSSDFAVLSSFREPISHFLSSFEHMQLKRMKDLTKKSNIPATLDVLIDQLKRGVHIHFDLRNFQSRCMASNGTDALDGTPSTVHERFQYMRSLYWFSIMENYELSLKLLQCQVFGYVDESKLKDVLAKKYNVRSSQSNAGMKYAISAQNLRDITDLNKDDMAFYQMAVVEFWNRIKVHSKCLNYRL